MITANSPTRLAALAVILAFYALASNLLLHTGDKLMFVEGDYSTGGFHYYYNWTTAVLQPWLWPFYWISEHLKLWELHGSISASLITGSVSWVALILLSICINRYFPRFYFPLVAVFGCLAIVGLMHVAKDIWIIRTSAGINELHLSIKNPEKHP